jgi:mannose-6-phosphate isomerase-like protein (cupin superfamily)
MDVINRDSTIPFTTIDGSEIRELLAPRNSAIRNQTLAEAIVAVGTATQEHYHKTTEEIYYILSGTGRMTLDGEVRDVRPLDAIAIPPGQRHTIANSGDMPLVLLCCCAPGYTDEDTVLVGTK